MRLLADPPATPPARKISRRERLAGVAGPAIPLLPAVPVLVLWLYWAQDRGGYFPRDWYPTTVLVLLLASVVAAAGGRLLPQARSARVVLALLAAFVAWSFLSLLWADSTGSARDAANKLLLVLAVTWTLALLPWSARSARRLLAAWSLGLAVLAGISLVGAAGTGELGTYLFEARYQHPVGYPNGNAALAVIGMLPALALCVDRYVHPLVAGLFLAVAALLADFAMLSQSRGSFVGLAVALPLLILLAPDRLRLAIRLLVLAGCVALAAGPILDVVDADDAGRALGPALDDAVAAIPLSAIVAGVAGALLAAGERAGGSHRRLHRAGRGLAVACVALAAAGLVALGVAKRDSISETIDDQVASLTQDEYEPTEGARISNLDPYERPDYWRVAIDLFEESPAIGAGAGSFEREYTARRREPKHSRYVHNLFLRSLAEGGLIGAGLLLGFFAAAFACGAVLRRRLAPRPALVLAAGLAVAAYFAVHASFDWLEELPAVAAPAFALPVVALVAAAGRDGAAPPAVRRSRLRLAGALAAGTAMLAALASVVPAYLSVRYVERAGERSGAERGEAFRDLERARGLRPDSLVPHLVEGRIAVEAGLYRRARRAFERSLTVEDNWYAYFQLALIDASEGRFAAAARRLRRARALNPRDSVLRRTGRRIDRKQRLDPTAINRAIRSGGRVRFTTSAR